MCYHKSLVASFDDLEQYYSASFESVKEELDLIKDRSLDFKSGHAESSKDEIAEATWATKTLASFGESGINRYHENGFDYLPAPILTSGAPTEFKLFRWGLIPFYMSDKEKAFMLRTSTLNCISEEMYDKPSYRDAAKNGQRCLIPITGFYEWHWNDEKGKVKIPWYIAVKSQPISSIAGLYSRWNDKTTGRYYYTYTVLTTTANQLMQEIHNSKKRMPVIIPKEYEKDWLGKNLSKDDVLALCQPLPENKMSAYTVSKLITTKKIDTNVKEVLALYDYEKESSK